MTLRPTVFDVLMHLVENPGRVVGKDELLAAVWPGRVVEEANLSQAIFWLRTALREHGSEDAEHLIVTVRGRGYRSTGHVRLETSPAPLAPPSRPADPAPGRAPSGRPTWPAPRPHRIGMALAATAALLLAIGAAGFGHWRSQRRLGPGNTIVLADFQNRTGDAAFDRTLGGVLRIDLSQSPYLTVMPDRQVRDTLALMTQPADTLLTAPLAQEVCVRSNADAVLDGAVAPVGARYVLTLTATDCFGRRALASATTEVAGRERWSPRWTS